MCAKRSKKQGRNDMLVTRKDAGFKPVGAGDGGIPPKWRANIRIKRDTQETGRGGLVSKQSPNATFNPKSST